MRGNASQPEVCHDFIERKIREVVDLPSLAEPEVVAHRPVVERFDTVGPEHIFFTVDTVHTVHGASPFRGTGSATAIPDPGRPGQVGG